MRSGISWLLRSRSLAMGLTSASTNSRTERRINSCSGVTSGIVCSWQAIDESLPAPSLLSPPQKSEGEDCGRKPVLRSVLKSNSRKDSSRSFLNTLLRGRVALANQDRPLVLEHLFAALVVAGGAEPDDAPVGPRGIALGEHQRLGSNRVAGINRLVPLHFFVAEMGNRAFAQVLDRKAEHHVHHQHVIDDDVLVAEALRILAIEVTRVEVHRDAGEKAVVALGDGATPVMLEKMADLEVLEVVATLDFAHRHVSQAAFFRWS